MGVGDIRILLHPHWISTLYLVFFDVTVCFLVHAHYFMVLIIQSINKEDLVKGLDNTDSPPLSVLFSTIGIRAGPSKEA